MHWEHFKAEIEELIKDEPKVAEILRRHINELERTQFENTLIPESLRIYLKAYIQNEPSKAEDIYSYINELEQTQKNK